MTKKASKIIGDVHYITNLRSALKAVNQVVTNFVVTPLVKEKFNEHAMRLVGQAISEEIDKVITQSDLKTAVDVNLQAKLDVALAEYPFEIEEG